MEILPVWNQQEGEPDQWYQRFQVYLGLGNKRNIDRAFNEAIDGNRDKSSPSKRASSQWRVIAKEWNWKSRAGAYDHASLQPLQERLQASRSQRIEKQIATEDEFADREHRLRDEALLWVENYLFGRVVKEEVTEEEGIGREGESISKRTTKKTPLQPPQWMIERFIGKRDYEKQFNVLMDLLKSIMAIEGTSEDLQQVKGIIQASLEGLLLESGVEEVRSLVTRGNS